jgi:hypothetical protein
MNNQESDNLEVTTVALTDIYPPFPPGYVELPPQVHPVETWDHFLQILSVDGIHQRENIRNGMAGVVEHNPIRSGLPNFASLTIGTLPHHGYIPNPGRCRGAGMNISTWRATSAARPPCGTDTASSDSCSRGIYARNGLSTPTKSTTQSCSTFSTKEPTVSQMASRCSPESTTQSPAQPPHGRISTTHQSCTAGPLQASTARYRAM